MHVSSILTPIIKQSGWKTNVSYTNWLDKFKTEKVVEDADEKEFSVLFNFVFDSRLLPSRCNLNKIRKTAQWPSMCKIVTTFLTDNLPRRYQGS